MDDLYLKKDKISYDLVISKLNSWYTTIKKNMIDDAEKMKNEIEFLLQDIQENQDVLLYYQLLEFRHELMLIYLKSKDVEDVQATYEILKEKEGSLTNMLEYYYFFFVGMYEFRRKELESAISAYNMAETKLSEVEDELERAEFYFKVSEVYYYMKQTYFSLNYAKRAIKIYRKYNIDDERILHCRFIVAGNLIDTLNYENAIHELIRGLRDAKRIGKKYLIATFHMNLGIVYRGINKYNLSVLFLRNALAVFQEENHIFMCKTLFNLSHVLAQKGEADKALLYFEKGNMIALWNKDNEYQAKFKLLKGLYFSNEDVSLINEALDYFESKKLFADIEEYAKEVADFFYQKGKSSLANEYYRKVIAARNEIRKGEIIHEEKNG
ncbi:Rap family tetratricopeptide repeat protein [Bacillus atrophaeus]|uniref:Rap family tetratricopeptide repeat protein n=1 Tax=Bacillus atrophaeus TaxID=1452 RepID=UPI002DB9E766|nr:Rap family tetratricopeptide repeat protein [Bacillus atrophaeus]MEC1900726.1 tetratricopeptide repeat protein [Bacillus atrophaeus]MEC2396561.1 tetratricopeptide repeat protein [Bacillus atrophaeus]MED4436216.1 tetratricopeptide repeat protein [Bacillus atrophaeus]MED4563822.1 tetratricopeptide repeat protein [Bacillus atrophaeus]MED4575137.1 tetratricopeptide repeat protein [Bacillus atrophaeus]